MDVDSISAHKVNKSIYGYWNVESMIQYYFDFIEGYLYTGKYYKLKKAKKIIDKSTYSERDKNNLKEFLYSQTNKKIQL